MPLKQFSSKIIGEIKVGGASESFAQFLRLMIRSTEKTLKRLFPASKATSLRLSRPGRNKRRTGQLCAIPAYRCLVRDSEFRLFFSPGAESELGNCQGF